MTQKQQKNQILKVKKLSNVSQKTPSYAKEGDAGLDLVATRIISETRKQIVYGTDIAVEIPEGFVGLLFPRSSIRNYDLSLANSVGLIDSGFRGELQVTFNKKFRFFKNKKYSIGDRVCQLVIIPFQTMTIEVVDNLSDSERGTGGHGSTNK